jgi:hypothetical protein
VVLLLSFDTALIVHAFPAWEAIDLCLRGYHRADAGESVFARRDYDIRLADPAVLVRDSVRAKDYPQ